MKTALVTGGAGAHGSAIARRLIDDGWTVIRADVRSGGEVVPLDVTDTAAVQRACDAVVAQHGTLDALVNAAGGRTGAEAGPFTASDPASWRPVIDVHLRGVINSCYAALPHMIAAQRGSIVSLAAFEGLRGDPNGAVFSAAKAGVILLSEMLVREVAPHGVRVNTVLPHAQDAPAVAGAVAFLLSDAAARTSGACLDVTDGWALR